MAIFICSLMLTLYYPPTKLMVGDCLNHVSLTPFRLGIESDFLLGTLY